MPPWSGGGGYRGGGGGSYSGRGGYTPVGYSPTDGGGGSGGTIASIVELGVLAVFVGHIIVDTRRRNRAFEVVPTADVDVGVLHVSLDARVRPLVQRELVRNANGVITTGEPGVPVAHADDGPGLVLVTLIVASRRELDDVAPLGKDRMLRALEGLSLESWHTFGAAEIVWTPADPAERLSSVTIEEQLALDVVPGALAGKVACASCAAVYPAERGACGWCGAPARDVA